MDASPLQQRFVLCGGGFAHHYAGAMPLSVKSFAGGAARYRTARGRYAVDEGSWLIINDQEPYAIDFESATPMRSTVVFFPADWAGRVARAFAERVETLLDEPDNAAPPPRFLETVMPDDGEVAPRLRRIDAACREKAAPEGWLEEELRDLLAAMLLSQSEHRRRAARLPATRAATRAELYRRVCRGRDFLREAASDAPSLADAARAAGLSPYHFQRTFKTAFGATPHAFATERKLEQARRLLESRAMPATEVAAAVGYESYGAFHAAFVRRFGAPPSRAL